MAGVQGMSETCVLLGTELWSPWCTPAPVHGADCACGLNWSHEHQRRGGVWSGPAAWPWPRCAQSGPCRDSTCAWAAPLDQFDPATPSHCRTSCGEGAASTSIRQTRRAQTRLCCTARTSNAAATHMPSADGPMSPRAAAAAALPGPPHRRVSHSGGAGSPAHDGCGLCNHTLTQVLSWLGVPDLSGSAALVCKRWHAASGCKEVWRRCAERVGAACRIGSSTCSG
jgi:hypothetical protein